MIRQSLDIRSWEGAQKIVREWESGNGKLELPDVGEAMKRFIADLTSRGLSREHIRKTSPLPLLPRNGQAKLIGFSV